MTHSVCARQGATLVHAAAAAGDGDLLKELVRSPYCTAQLAVCRTFSPLLYALANRRSDTVAACLQHGLGPYDDDPIAYTLATVILTTCGVSDSPYALRRLLGQQEVHEDTRQAVLAMLSSAAPPAARVRQVMTSCAARSGTCGQQDLVTLIKERVRARRGAVDDALLVAAAVTGRTCGDWC